MTNKEQKTIRILFTGGFDSTYMLCKLSRKPGITIEPIYVLNPKRKSRNNELRAMNSTLKLLRNKPSTRSNIKDLQIINRSDINVSKEICDARRKLSKEIGLLGYQYEYLSALTLTLGDLGVGIEKPSNGERSVGANATLQKNGGVIKRDGFFRLDLDKASPEAKIVFQHMFFPIIDTSELSMLEDFKKWGYEDIMQNIWFCHSPINGEPCGLCRPCEEKMDSKMDILLPQKAQKRYFKAQKWHFLGKNLSRKIKNLKIFILKAFYQ